MKVARTVWTDRNPRDWVVRDSEADKKVEADKKAAKAVTEEVSKLPATDKLTVKNEAAVKAAREAFNKLTADQKRLVAEAEKTLKAAEAKIAELKGEQPAEEKNYKLSVNNEVPLPGSTVVVFTFDKNVDVAKYDIKANDKALALKPVKGQPGVYFAMVKGSNLTVEQLNKIVTVTLKVAK